MGEQEIEMRKKERRNGDVGRVVAHFHPPNLCFLLLFFPSTFSSRGEDNEHLE